MAFPNNILQNVQTYQRSGLAFLENTCVLTSLANKKFKDFENKTANLGSSITFDLPPRFTTANGLVATVQELAQRVLNLTCDQAANTSFAYTTQQFLFNVRDYMEQFGKSAVKQLGSTIEANLALNMTGQVPVYNVTNGQQVPTGAYHTESGAYRFYGDGVTPINSYKQLAQAVANFVDFGADSADMKGIIPVTAIPNIIDTGLNQFTIDRGNTTSKNWMLGEFSECMWYRSNLLPTFTAGNVGQNGTTLTVVSTNDPTGNNVTQITFSGATVNDQNAIVNGDMGQFQDGVSGQTNLRFLTFIGQNVSSQPVQFRVTANAAANGSGNVTLNITPAMCWASGNANQNLNTPIVAGQQVKLLPSHKVGYLYSGDSFFLAMPMMPDTAPFPSSSKNDDKTGAAMRQYYGFLIGQNQYGMFYDQTWAGVMAPDYGMRLVFPL